MASKAASEIQVRAYRQILIWPLLLKNESGLNQMDAWIESFRIRSNYKWNEASTLPSSPTRRASDDPLSCDPTYEEIVYFHPFVRDFLYGDGGEPSSRALRRLRRTDVKTLEIELSTGTPVTCDLDVMRVELYLC